MHIHLAQGSYIIQRNYLKKYKGKYWKSEFGHLKLLNLFKRCFMALVFIPEVLTDLLTPILPYLYLTCVRWHMRQIWHFWHFWHKWRIWHLPFVMVRYGNMGVKRSVRTSGMQTNAIKHLLNMFNSLKCQNTDFQNSLCIFWNFLCIMYNLSGHFPSSLRFEIFPCIFSNFLCIIKLASARWIFIFIGWKWS